MNLLKGTEKEVIEKDEKIVSQEKYELEEAEIRSY